MEFVDVHASIREGRGKEISNKMRKEGIVPAVVYKKGDEALSIKVDRKEMVKALHTEAGENVIIKLTVEGAKKDKERTVILKDIQSDPVKDRLIHIDFQEISLTETLEVKVPVVSKGEAIGVKQEEGVLEQVLWEIDLECLPTNIPEKIEVDVANLKIGDSVHVKDFVLPEGVKILGDPEGTVFHVEHAKKMEEPSPEEAAGEGAQEPEVIGEKKETEEEGPEETEEGPKVQKEQKEQG